jgi:hypothetical protein
MTRRTPLVSHRWGRVVGSGLVALGLVLAQSHAALADQQGKDGTATFDDQKVVELTKAGQSKGRSGLAFHQTRADQVTATNAAVAYTSCDGCRAVALSFQVVVADGNPSSLDVGNLALAMNENCTGCESVAVAYQVVLASDRRLSLTSDGRAELSDLRRQLHDLARSDLAVTDIEQQAQSLMAGVATVLASELQVKARVRCDKDVERRPGRGQHGDHGDGQPGSSDAGQPSAPSSTPDDSQGDGADLGS